MRISDWSSDVFSSDLADLGQVALLPHRLDHPVELGPVGEEIRFQRKQPGKGLIEEDEAMLAVELSDARRETIEHVSLGADEAGEVGPRLLPFLDVDRIARDSRGAHRSEERRVGKE